MHVQSRIAWLTALGVWASSPTRVTEQSWNCDVDMRLDSLWITGLTADVSAQRRVVDTLHLPPVAWRDSLWIQVRVSNVGTRSVTAVQLHVGVFGVAGPVRFVEAGGIFYPDYPSILRESFLVPSAVYFHDSLFAVRPGSDTTIAFGPFRLAEVLPWIAETTTWHVAVTGIEAMARIIPFEPRFSNECFDDPSDNGRMERVPVLTLY